MSPTPVAILFLSAGTAHALTTAIASHFAVMRDLAWLLFAVLPAALLLGAAVLRRRWRPRVRAGLAAAAIVIAAVGAYSTLVEPRWLEVSHLTLPSNKIDRCLSIALLTDLQTDRPGDFEAHALAVAARAAPDLVLFGGDYIQIREQELYLAAADRLAAIIHDSGLDPPLGAYAVAGNVDRRGIWPRVFAGTGIVTCTGTARFDLGPLVLTTLSMVDSFDTNLVLAAEEKFHLVLGHAPDYSMGRIGADLLTAGHTHGGQVRLPFFGPLLTFSRVPRSRAAGATQISPESLLVVSRGLGMERGDAPRLRFACRPQVVFIELVPG